MSKRGSGEGSVRQRADGRWEGTLRLAGGRRKSVYGKTQRDVLQRLTRAKRDRELGLPMRSERTTTAAYLTRWLDSARPSLRPRTWERYEQYVRLHAVPAIGSVPLARLGPQDLQELYAAQLAAGASSSSVHHLAMVLHRALEQAVEWGLCVRNVADVVRAPRIGRREMTTLTPEQAREFLDVVAGVRLEGLYALAITTGMRQGELLALRWTDLDLDRGAAAVRSTLHRVRDGFTFAPPKTAKSRRQVTLTKTAIAALRRHRARQIEERLRAGAAWQDSGLVFTDEIGGPLTGSGVTHAFQRILHAAGLPRIRFHDLRHTAATLMLGRGVHPKIASEMLGHSTIAITLDLYSHVTPTMQRAAADELDAVLAARP